MTRAQHGSSRLPVYFATIWLSGQVIRSLLFEIVTGSPVPASGLHWFEQTGLICLRLVSTVPGTLVVAASFVAMHAASRLPVRSARIAKACCLAIPFALSLVSFSSWAGFYTTGQFMGFEAWSLALASPSLLLDHVVEIEPLTLLAVPCAALGVLLLNLRLCRWTYSWNERRTFALVRGVAGVLLLSLGVAFAANVAAEHDTATLSAQAGSAPRSPHEAYVDIGMDRSGPIARLLVDAFHTVTVTTLRAARWAGTSGRGNRVIAPEEYSRTVKPANVPRLSVIVVLVESLRRDEVMTEGGTRDVLPGLEALAREATVYTDVIAPAAQSDFATTSVLSSQFPLRSITYHPFPLHIPYPRVLPYDIFKSFGYRTAVFSSQNERWAGMYNFLYTSGVDHFLHAETFNGPTYAANADRGLREWMDKTGHAGKIDDRNTISEAISWVDSIAPRAPFFAYINLQASHNPYLAPRNFTPRFGSGRVSFPILFDVYPADSAPAVRDMYDNSLAYADAQLTRLFDALKTSGRWDSTIVAVLGDHGEAFYEHGFGAHGGELYGEVTRVPLIIRVPSRPPARDSLPASSIDVMPTILGILNLPPHPAYQGIDLAERTARTHRPRFSLTQTAMADEVSVVQDGWKLLFDIRHSLTRLYYLRDDPLERHDVAGVFPVQRDALMGTMASWWAGQIGYYEKLPAQPQFYAPASPLTAPLDPPPISSRPR